MEFFSYVPYWFLHTLCCLHAKKKKKNVFIQPRGGTKISNSPQVLYLFRSLESPHTPFSLTPTKNYKSHCYLHIRIYLHLITFICTVFYSMHAPLAHIGKLGKQECGNKYLKRHHCGIYTHTYTHTHTHNFLLWILHILNKGHLLLLCLIYLIIFNFLLLLTPNTLIWN